MTARLTLRLIVREPVPGVALRIQRGKSDLVDPVSMSSDDVTFEIEVGVYAVPGGFTLRGPEVQGPPAERFVYVNVGTYAGQPASPWSRRTKIPLGGITAALIEAAQSHGNCALVAEIGGRARDGGPAAATVKLLGNGWTVEARTGAGTGPRTR